MRDSNSRGVAPNTLSNTADMCSLRFATVRDLRRCSRTDGGGRRCTPVNETEDETRRRTTAGRCGVVLHDLIPQTREQAPPVAGVMRRAGRDVTRSLLGTGAAIRRRRRCCGTGCNASKAPSASERSKARECGLLVAYLTGYSADLEERSLRAGGGLLLAVRFALEVAIAGGRFGWISRLGPARRRRLRCPLRCSVGQVPADGVARTTDDQRSEGGVQNG
jgi:hypothetical protein